MLSFLMQNLIQIASNGGQNGKEIHLYPLVKHSLHCAHTKPTITKQFFADIRRILLTLDTEKPASHLHP
jgi:hypothetical protein